MVFDKTISVTYEKQQAQISTTPPSARPFETALVSAIGFIRNLFPDTPTYPASPQSAQGPRCHRHLDVPAPATPNTARAAPASDPATTPSTPGSPIRPRTAPARSPQPFPHSSRPSTPNPRGSSPSPTDEWTCVICLSEHMPAANRKRHMTTFIHEQTKAFFQAIVDGLSGGRGVPRTNSVHDPRSKRYWKCHVCAQSWTDPKNDEPGKHLRDHSRHKAKVQCCYDCFQAEHSRVQNLGANVVPEKVELSFFQGRRTVAE